MTTERLNRTWQHNSLLAALRYRIEPGDEGKVNLLRQSTTRVWLLATALPKELVFPFIASTHNMKHDPEYQVEIED